MIKQIVKVIIFTIAITYLVLHFQWLEFYKGYSYSEENLLFSIIFLLAWLLFSFYWGMIQEKKYLRFISIYWGIGIIACLIICIFANTQSFLFPFYIWYGGPLYGFRYAILMLCGISIDRTILMLITLPFGIVSCFTGYWLGCCSVKKISMQLKKIILIGTILISSLFVYIYFN